MDDLLREFLTETGEHLDTVDAELVRFERHPGDDAILRNVFRLVHTIKGTCGFLGLPRLEALTHAAETLMGRLRDGMPVTSEAVTLILATVDRIKLILAELDRASAEPLGSDGDLIAELELAAAPTDTHLEAACEQVLLRPLRPGEVSLDELERAFRDTPGPSFEAPPPAFDAGSVPLPSGPADGADEPLHGLSEPGDGPSARAHTIRVPIDTLEHLMTMVSELVLTRNQLLDLARKTDGEGGFKAPLQRLSHVTAELQDGIMKTRMQPIGSAWAKLPRVLRDLAPELGKKIELVTQGAETELDRQLLEIIRDPLTHMVRNSADHGIETPRERIAVGKPETGTIRLNAFHEGGTVTVELSDDGRGLDHAAIRRRAAENGIASEAELARMSDDEVAPLIFHAGLSTSAAVSSVSGRGVGMDVVRTHVDLIGGTVEIASERGRGTVFTIKIPLTLAIVAALIVEIGGQRFALPQVAAVELVRVGPGSGHALERIEAVSVMRLRDELLPVLPVGDLLGLCGPQKVGPQEVGPHEVGSQTNGPAADDDTGFVVVTQVGRQRFGLLVEAVLETEEIVVKPMSTALRHIPFFSGTTVLGDGTVVLILDPNGIARRIGSETMRGIADAGAPADILEAVETTTLLLVRGRDGTPRAVPLSLVTRLEEIDRASIEHLSGQPAVQYRGRLMPLLTMEGEGEIGRSGLQPVVVFSAGHRTVGLCVAAIVDVVDAALGVDPIPGRPDLVGSAVVCGRATEILDMSGLLPWANEAGIKGGSSGPTLLLVDADPVFRDLLTPLLKAAGYRVRTAASGEEALLVSAGTVVDRIVADLDLPDRDGLALLEELGRDPRHRGATAILMARTASPETLRRARDIGVFDVVAKSDRRGVVDALAEASVSLRLAA